jgi:hypothetical protein
MIFAINLWRIILNDNEDFVILIQKDTTSVESL